MEDRHTLTARALLARLHDEKDWTSAIAAELRAAERAAFERAVQVCIELTTRRAAEMGLGHYDHLTGYQCAVAIHALIPTEPK